LVASPRDDGRTVLAAQSFRAPYHLSKPYWDADQRVLMVQVVNPTAGILAGDALESHVTVDSGASLLVTTPSASRVFRMRTGEAECRQQFTVEKSAWLEVLPEPLVPHRGCRYRQSTRVNVEKGGSLLLFDLLMPGRVGHGEAWGWEKLCLESEVRVDGELVLRERFEQTGDGLRELAALARSGERACFGNAVLIAEGDAPWAPAVAALHGPGVWLGVSPLRRDGWSIKFVTADSVALRRTVKRIREILGVSYPGLRVNPRKL